MSAVSGPGVLFLHALPLDGSMWSAQRASLAVPSFAPTLYALGERLEDWAAAVLRQVTQARLIVVGCSIGGSCALEMAAAAPERVAALVLIGTKAKHSPDPELQSATIGLIEREGLAAAWSRTWAPLFSASTDRSVVEAARCVALRQPPEDIVRGVTAFHSRRSRERFVARCGIPLTVVTGEDDVAPGVEHSAGLADSAARGRVQVIPSCGHYVPLERPDALSAILDEVVTSHT